MEEEIDLRPYIEALFRHRYWIVGIVVLTAGVAFLVTRFVPSIYETKSSIACFFTSGGYTFLAFLPITNSLLKLSQKLELVSRVKIKSHYVR